MACRLALRTGCDPEQNEELPTSPRGTLLLGLPSTGWGRDGVHLLCGSLVPQPTASCFLRLASCLLLFPRKMTTVLNSVVSPLGCRREGFSQDGGPSQEDLSSWVGSGHWGPSPALLARKGLIGIYLPQLSQLDMATFLPTPHILWDEPRIEKVVGRKLWVNDGNLDYPVLERSLYCPGPQTTLGNSPKLTWAHGNSQGKAGTL